MRKITFFKTMLAAVMLLVGSVGLMSQGLETFENHALSGTSYVDGSFVGDNGVTWSYVHVTGEQEFPINNKGILLRRSEKPSSITSSIISGGIGSFSLQMRKAFTSAGDRQIALYINGNHIANSQIFGAPSGADATVHTFSVSDINIGGDFRIEVRHITGEANNRQLVIDNLSWTAYSGGGATPTITVTEMSVPAMSATIGNSDTKNISVSGVNLTDNIDVAISGENAAYFSATPNTITHSEGAVSDASVTITYSPLAAGSHAATLTLSSPGAASVTRALTGTSIATPDQVTPPNVIIAEVYGGGGNSGATLKNDFIELYNTTSSAVDISGWSVQYYAATGTSVVITEETNNKLVIPDGKSIPAKSHFLIQASAGTNTGATVDLPSPDAVSVIGASGSAGKIILFTSDVDVTISDINSIINHDAFKDYVPYGTTSVPVWGSAMSANTANATSASRKLIGGSYSYTQNIGYDFEVVTPTPQNTLWTSVQSPKLRTDVYTVNGTIRFNATAGQTVEVYTVIGQQIISTQATDGLNIIPVKAKGMMVVRIGGKSAKVVM